MRLNVGYAWYSMLGYAMTRDSDTQKMTLASK
jgi:hypothetical protein